MHRVEAEGIDPAGGAEVGDGARQRSLDQARHAAVQHDVEPGVAEVEAERSGAVGDEPGGGVDQVQTVGPVTAHHRGGGAVAEDQ